MDKSSIDVKIDSKGNDEYVFTDISGKTHDVKVSMDSQVMTNIHLQLFSKMYNFYLMKLNDEKAYMSNIQTISDDENVILIPLDITKDSLIKESENNLQTYQKELNDIEKIFSDSLLSK